MLNLKNISKLLSRIRIRIFKTGSADPDPDPEKNGPDPQHWLEALKLNEAKHQDNLRNLAEVMESRLTLTNPNFELKEFSLVIILKQM